MELRDHWSLLRIAVVRRTRPAAYERLKMETQMEDQFRDELAFWGAEVPAGKRISVKFLADEPEIIHITQVSCAHPRTATQKRRLLRAVRARLRAPLGGRHLLPLPRMPRLRPPASPPLTAAAHSCARLRWATSRTMRRTWCRWRWSRRGSLLSAPSARAPATSSM